jgi:uncharacterized protein (DUF2237 family)
MLGQAPFDLTCYKGVSGLYRNEYISAMLKADLEQKTVYDVMTITFSDRKDARGLQDQSSWNNL